jgi:hypothetical protein
MYIKYFLFNLLTHIVQLNIDVFIAGMMFRVVSKPSPACCLHLLLWDQLDQNPYRSRTISRVVSLKAVYSSSVVERETVLWVLLAHETGPPHKRINVPDTDFRPDLDR